MSIKDTQFQIKDDMLGDLNTSMDGMTATEKSNIISTIFKKQT